MVGERLVSRSRRLALGLADGLVTMPLLRWTWRGQADTTFSGDLPDFRPADPDAVRDMMAGRYLLAAKLVETGGLSPFSVDIDHVDWWNSLHGFSWLRHFRDVRDPGERHFARTLVLDWIGREGRFEEDSWTLSLTAQRILNWLRYLGLLLDGATLDQARTIQRSLATQVQSLRIRSGLAAEPVDTLYAAMGLLGAELCRADETPELEPLAANLDALLGSQLDSDGLHLSRNGKVQLALLVELSSLRRAMGRHGSPAMAELHNRIDRMHEALDAITLSSGEPAYFNGCGQLPHDILVAIQATGPVAGRRSRILGGYGILRAGDSVVVADTGLRPPPGFDREAHAGALAFEFSHGNMLVLGSCGPAPAEMGRDQALFRQASAHSSPSIDGADAVPPFGKPGAATLVGAEHMLTMATSGYATRFGVELERRLTLLAEGTTLVGQDRVLATGKPQGQLAIRFHLAPGVAVRQADGEGLVRLQLSNGSVWSFLWEGASLREEESVRQSATVGFHRTRQLVLEAEVGEGAEIAWILTREQ